MTTAAPFAQSPEHFLKQNGDMSQGKAITGHPCVSPKEKREMYDYLSNPGSEVNVPFPKPQALGLLAQIPPSSRLTDSLQPPPAVCHVPLWAGDRSWGTVATQPVRKVTCCFHSPIDWAILAAQRPLQ